MREKRIIKAIVTSDYNEAVQAINNKEKAIIVKGSAYEEVMQEVDKALKDSKSNKRFSKTFMGLGILSLIAAMPVLGAAVGGFGFLGLLVSGNEYKKYKIIDDVEEKKLKLYRIKGDDAIDFKYDTVVEE